MKRITIPEVAARLAEQVISAAGEGKFKGRDAQQWAKITGLLIIAGGAFDAQSVAAIDKAKAFGAQAIKEQAEAKDDAERKQIDARINAEQRRLNDEIEQLENQIGWTLSNLDLEDGDLTFFEKHLLEIDFSRDRRTSKIVAALFDALDHPVPLEKSADGRWEPVARSVS